MTSEPTQSAQPSQTLVDTRVMAVLHSFYRREYRLAGGLLRAVAPGDRQRAQVVAEHLGFLSRSLHHHHTIEDTMLWPVLVERVPEELAPLVHLMEAQHARVDGLVEEITPLLAGFATSADPAVRDRLADLLDTLYVHLAEHLDAEEERLMPIVSRSISQAEWDALGEAGRSGVPKGMALLTLGMYQHEGDPDAFATMLADAPPPVRWLLPKLARRAFRRYAVRVHGTATP